MEAVCPARAANTELLPMRTSKITTMTLTTIGEEMGDYSFRFGRVLGSTRMGVGLNKQRRDFGERVAWGTRHRVPTTLWFVNGNEEGNTEIFKNILK